MNDLLILAMVWLGFAVLIALTTRALLARLLTRLDRLSPARRSQWLWMICGAPAWGGLALCALCLTPSVLGFIWPGLDHCADHAHHAHLCLVHGTAAPLKSVWLAPLLLALAVVGWRLAGSTRQLLRARALLAALERTARRDAQSGAYLLDVEDTWAFVGGLLRQRVFVSNSLRQQLSPDQMALVLAHERAHVSRRDNLRRLTASLLSSFHLPSTRLLLLDRLELACEQACDDLTARSERERLQLAQTLLRLSLLVEDRSSPAAYAASAAVGHLEPRVQALLSPPTRPRDASAWSVAITCVLIALLTEPLHHATETLLNLLLD
ncbi:MAG: hypothetical protein CMH57_05650 [Myxococcales bacterium]|nr:hypothetical protein [Myxococcales bacterium]